MLDTHNIGTYTLFTITSPSHNTMTVKNVLITGANSGIGYETVKIVLQSRNNYHVYLGSRSLERGRKALQGIQSETLEATNTIEVLQIDLSSDESIGKGFEDVQKGSGRLDVLFDNADKHVILD